MVLMPKSNKITYKKMKLQPTSLMKINIKILNKVLADILATEKKNSNSSYLSRFTHRCMDGSTLGNVVI